MAFRTKLDYSDNRQIKQRERTETTLSGTTVFGMPFSALTSGPDLTATAQTSQYFGVISTYSGNSATTVFTWGIPGVSAVDSSISALTPSNSGVSQNISAVFGSSSTTTIDGNIVNLTYSGVSASNLYPITMGEPTPGSYTGTVSTDFFIYSAQTLDFTGRTIWVDNTEILRTKKLIVTNNPQIGYVLTCADSEGMVSWGPVSGSTSGSTYWSASTGTNAIVTLNSNSTALGTNSLAEGYQSNAFGDYSHAEGYLTAANGESSHTEGNQSAASGDYSHAEGSTTTASGLGSHAEGFQCVASGDYSHAEGYITTSVGPYSHAEGHQTRTKFNAFYAHAEGYFTYAMGDSSHAEGYYTTADSTSSHAEGNHTIATGSSSHAEGYYTIATGSFSHAEGQFTSAIGQVSHSEGVGTIASGDGSHAGGSGSTASGIASFVHSVSSTVTGNRSAVIGGQGITGSADDTVYVPDLVIDGLTNTDPIATDVNGKIVAGVSDVRLKKNIETLPTALDVIKNLRGVSFEYTDESNMGPGVRFGFIAQEVQEIVPELVRSRAKSDSMLNLNYSEIIPWIVEAIKEITTPNNLILESQTIAAEDNNIELNYNGTKTTAIGGGISLINGISDGINAELKLNSEGSWVTNNSISPLSLIIPEYTPNSSLDNYGKIGDITRDNNYLYIKGSNGWKRSSLESF